MMRRLAVIALLTALATPALARRPPPHEGITVDGYSPQSGGVGTRVVITGSGFRKQTKLIFGGRPLEPTEQNPSTIVFRVPARAGDGLIVLRHPGAGNDVTVGYFNLIGDPIVAGFSPEHGPAGSRVELSGSGFAPGDQVIYNGRVLGAAEVSPGRIVVVIPPGATSDFFTVSRPGGAGSVSSRRFIVTLPAPVIGSFSPTGGPPGTRVRLEGINLTLEDRVFYGATATPVVGRGEGWLEANVPAGARTNERFFVRGPRGESATAQPFVVLITPVIAGFAPGYGPPGIRVEINGSYFQSGDRVLLGGRPVPVVSIQPRRILVDIPPDAVSGQFAIERGMCPDQGPGTMRCMAVQIVATSKGRFDVLSQPVLTGFAPAAGPVGTRVTLSGDHFTPDAVVVYGAQALPIVGRAGDSSLDVVIPAGATDQLFSVRTRGGQATAPQPFRVHVYSVLDSISPVAGPVGTRVVIRGRFFGPGDDFYLGRTPLPIVERHPGEYVVEIPPGAESGVLEWTSFGRRQPSRFRFTVLEPLSVTSFSPQVGFEGDWVTLTGTGLGAASKVFFGSLPCPIVRRSAPSTIAIRIPAGAQGVDYFWVEDRGQRVRSAQPFEVIAPLALSSFSPASGPVGTEVTILGSGFTDTTSIFYGGEPAPIVRSRLPTVLVVSVPPGPPSDYFYAIDLGPRARSAQMFRLLEGPSVTGLTPPTGPIGSQVTILGAHFTPSARVYFGGLPCPVIAVPDPGRIVVAVPQGARGRDVFTVEDQGVRLQTPQPFDVQELVDNAPPGHPPHDHYHTHPHESGGHHHHPHAHPHPSGLNHHHPY